MKRFDELNSENGRFSTINPKLSVMSTTETKQTKKFELGTAIIIFSKQVSC